MLEESRSNMQKLVVDIKNHVIQLEILSLVIIALITITSLRDVFAKILGPTIATFIPLLFIAVTPIFVRVTNPPSKMRDRFTWGLGGAGIGGAIGTAADMFLFPLTGLPIGTLGGLLVGGLAGAVAGPKIESGAAVLMQGEAREYLVSIMKHYPGLDLKQIVDATELPPRDPSCCIYMFFSDGIIKTSKEEIEKWLKTECWKG